MDGDSRLKEGRREQERERRVREEAQRARLAEAAEGLKFFWSPFESLCLCIPRCSARDVILEDFLHCALKAAFVTPAAAKRLAERSLNQRLIEEATARQALEQALLRRSDEG